MPREECERQSITYPRRFRRLWWDALARAFEQGQENPLPLAERALGACPRDGRILYISLAALLQEKPDQRLRYQKRLETFLPEVHNLPGLPRFAPDIPTCTDLPDQKTWPIPSLFVRGRCICCVFCCTSNSLNLSAF